MIIFLSLEIKVRQRYVGYVRCEHPETRIESWRFSIDAWILFGENFSLTSVDRLFLGGNFCSETL